jgi:flagellin
MKAEAASLKIGIQNGTEAMQAVEMLNNDIQAMNDIVVRLEELYALSTNGFNTTTDAAAIEAEAGKLLTEIQRIASDATWKGNALADGAGKTIGFGRNGGSLAIQVADITLPQVKPKTESARALDAKDIANVAHAIPSGGAAGDDDLLARTVATYSSGAIGLGVPAALATLKSGVDTMAVNAGALYNQVSNVMSHLGSLNAGYALDVASKMDVDFAGETTELAKGQILAQAGTAMLAQANAQGQGMLALIQS